MNENQNKMTSERLDEIERLVTSDPVSDSLILWKAFGSIKDLIAVARQGVQFQKLSASYEQERNVCDTLTAELEALRKDRERLDWIFKTLNDVDIASRIKLISDAFVVRLNGCHDVYTAIDSAMKKEKSV